MITKTMNLAFNRTPEQENKMTNQELFADYVMYAVKEVYKEGLDNQWRRIWARIQRKMDAGIEAKAETISLENGELDFMKKAFKDVKFPIELAKYVVVLEDELERPSDEEESNFEAPKKK